MRCIRLYLELRVLPRPPFKGSATRYQRGHLLALLAIRRLRAAERLELAAIRARLQGMSAKELEAFATQSLPAGPLSSALGLQSATAAAVPATTEARPGTARGGANALGSPQWARLELALGLELHVRADASTEVMELAQRVRELCAR
jgi:hypothetical protein